MRRERRRRLRPVLLAGVLVLPAPGTAEPAEEARLQALEAQLRTLTARVEALERRGSGGAADSGTTTDESGAIVWTLGDVVAGTPLRITHKQLDLEQGRLDLLLEITAPLAAPARWTGADAEVPLIVTVRDADGAASSHRFRVIRGTSSETGARLHLSTDIDPARAAAARQLIIDRSTD